MIIVNYWEGLDEDDKRLDLVSVINDVFCVFSDPCILEYALENQEEVEFKKETLYTLYFQRATIDSSYPLTEPYFHLVHFTELESNNEVGAWSEPVFRF